MTITDIIHNLREYLLECSWCVCRIALCANLLPTSNSVFHLSAKITKYISKNIVVVILEHFFYTHIYMYIYKEKTFQMASQFAAIMIYISILFWCKDDL